MRSNAITLAVPVRGLHRGCVESTSQLTPSNVFASTEACDFATCELKATVHAHKHSNNIKKRMALFLEARDSNSLEFTLQIIFFFGLVDLVCIGREVNF
jgi:hypothetical protein